MSTRDRRPYETATVLDQEVLDNSADNLVQKLEMIAVITTPNLTLRVSDRAKFVGGSYYEPRVVFPNINRTVGDWLAGVLEFSSLEIEVNNTDGKFNPILPGGDDYDGFIGSEIVVSVGLAEIASTYTDIFKGNITDVGGFARSSSSFSITARSELEKVNVTIPFQVILEDDFPSIEENFVGLALPVIYGDWTTDHRPEAPAIPVFPVNGNDPLVNADLEDPGAGNTALKVIYSSTPIKSLDTATVTLLRGDVYHTFASSDITIIPATDNTAFEITQKNLMIDGSPWIYSSGDEIFVECIGVDLSGYDDNIVWQSRDILMRFGGLSSGDFDSSWAYYRDKSSPSESNIAAIKSRVWVQDAANAFEYVLSMLEQVRIEAFVGRDNKFKLLSLHFDEFEATPSFEIKNWDIAKGSMSPQVDDRNNFNRAQADFDFDPSSGENRLGTPLFRNQASVTQAGRAIGKLISYPNLYDLTQVETQLKEAIKLASGYTEMVDVVLTPRMFLLDIGGFVALDFDIGSINYEGAPAMIRTLGYDPKGPSLPARLWSFQLIDFPGHTGPPGTVGGSTAVITQET